jgi:PIN domain nuclease of toxin-antitoxin system
MHLLLDTHAFLWAISGSFTLVSADAAFAFYGCPLQDARR